jgi:hypothetical protein
MEWAVVVRRSWTMLIDPATIGEDSRDRTQLPPSVEDEPGVVIGSSCPELLWTKLVAPAPRAGLLPRAGLQSLLQASLQAKLCVVAAPAGSGKTTLLAQWQAVAGEGPGGLGVAGGQ